MTFNIVTRNQDDHVKNIAFLMDKAGRWPQFAEEASVSADWQEKIARTLRLERF